MKQDHQYIVKPARVTDDYGSKLTFKYSLRSYDLPDTVNRWHVWTYNAFLAKSINIEIPVTGKWYKLTELMKDQGFLFDIYTVEGYMLAKDDVYLSQLNNGLFLIAIKDRFYNKFKLGIKEIYCRSYCNAWFQESDFSSTILFEHFDIKNKNDGLIALSYLYELRTMPGHSWVIYNGYYYELANWDAYSVNAGDWIEVITDTSVKMVLEYPLANPKFYTSLMDKKQKYILHHEFWSDEVNHYMDVDFYLQYDNGPSLYLHRNDPTLVRMLTHKDYGLAVDNVTRTQQSQGNWIDGSLLKVRAVIRNSGMPTKLIYENSRITELYKVPEEDFIKTIHGILANLPEWHVSALEQNLWFAIMENRSTCFDLKKIIAAMGYNSITKYLADTPQKLDQSFGTKKGAILPVLDRTAATVFEYDSKGLLLTYTNSFTAKNYFARVNNAASIEVIPNLSSDKLNEFYDSPEVEILPDCNYRCYIAKRIADTIDNETWVDVTDTDFYSIVEKPTGKKYITWSLGMEYVTLVRFDNVNLVYDLMLDFSDGVIDFNISSVYKLTWDRIAFPQTQLVPMGQYDFYLQNHLLAENIDYVIDFPRVVIFNKKYIDSDSKLQKITVRGHGYCNRDLSISVKRESGFIIDGKLSNNSTFTVRDDIVMRYSVDGKLRHYSDLAFQENKGSIADPSLNGLPYMASEIIIPLNKGIIDNEDYVELRNKARDLDHRIEDYMKDRVVNDLTAVHVIPEHYPLYSPLVFSIIMDVIHGIIPEEEIRKPLVDMRLLNLTEENYHRWFKYDPVNPALGLSEKVVMIHPHPFIYTIHLDLYQYRFVKRVTDLYTRGRVIMSHFVQFKE